jgi:hypothetical protein
MAAALRLGALCSGGGAAMAGPGDEIAAGAGDRGRLRASHADREQVIDALKAAFVRRGCQHILQQGIWNRHNVFHGHLVLLRLD